ncbi:hypothetical protein [Ferrimonas balearica]|uniref:hypothetical protein n=1 Tax=Ferrimonas balearica TaxID=44012 RepID=UPI001C99B4BD|nr:hypothetical protein [Ferrimonas balearica]MBY5993817.1 hypothetical protein [Ferrimonas balearica]
MNRLMMLLLAAALLTACSPHPDQARPESVALDFFDALYNRNDATRAMQLVDEELGELMAHYRLASQIQRNIIGLAMTDVELSVAEVDIDFFRRNSNRVEVLIQFQGHKGGRVMRDDRLVRLERVGERWIITHLYSDPFKTNG